MELHSKCSTALPSEWLIQGLTMRPLNTCLTRAHSTARRPSLLRVHGCSTIGCVSKGIHGRASPGSKNPVSLAGEAHRSVALYVVELPSATCMHVAGTAQHSSQAAYLSTSKSTLLAARTLPAPPMQIRMPVPQALCRKGKNRATIVAEWGVEAAHLE